MVNTEFSLTALIVLGALTSYMLKQHYQDAKLPISEKVASFFKVLTSSLFVAYLAHLVALVLIENEHLQMAFTGFASFAGADLLMAAQSGFIKAVVKKITGEKE